MQKSYMQRVRQIQINNSHGPKERLRAERKGGWNTLKNEEIVERTVGEGGTHSSLSVNEKGRAVPKNKAEQEGMTQTRNTMVSQTPAENLS